jgi:hypothetical protein
MTRKWRLNRTDLRFGKEFYEILQCDEIRRNGKGQATLEQLRQSV